MSLEGPLSPELKDGRYFEEIIPKQAHRGIEETKPGYVGEASAIASEPVARPWNSLRFSTWVKTESQVQQK